MLDADVLLPVLSCDLLLTGFEAGLFQPIVTPKILAEVQRNLVADFHRVDPSVLIRRAGFMAGALRLHTHADVNDGPDELASVNAKDRHVAEIGVRLKANVIVTNDRRLRREVNRLDLGMSAVTSDEFLASLCDQNLDGVSAVIDTLVGKRTRPAIDREELLDKVKREFPEAVRRLRSDSARA